MNGKVENNTASGSAVKARQSRASSALGFANANPCALGLPGPGADGDLKMAKDVAGKIELPPLNIQQMDITVIGDTPLICHAWSSKAKKQMLDKQMKKAKPGKEAKDPEDDFIQSLYPLPDGSGYGFPVIAFKNAAVTACTSVDGITKVAARQAFRVGSTLLGSELVKIEGADPEPREDMVRIGMGTADIRYRGQFVSWWCTVRVRFNANVLSAEQIVNLFNTAGFGVGLGEWRMERDGQFGCFHVATEEDLKRIGLMQEEEDRRKAA